MPDSSAEARRLIFNSSTSEYPRLYIPLRVKNKIAYIKADTENNKRLL